MTLLLRGKTICNICGQVIGENDEAVGFSPFVMNAADPLFRFDDAAMHATCFASHPLAEKAKARYEEVRSRLAPSQRICMICSKKISDPDDYFGLGHLVDSPDSKLYRFNYAQFHRSCLSQWEDLPSLVGSLVELDESGTWKGDRLKALVRELRNM